MDTNFSKFVLKANKELNPLPLVHTTEASLFRKILEEHKIDAINCDRFGENLIYFFYGRPAYVINPDMQPTTLSAYDPVCFLLKPLSIKTVKRIYPFDSGAFKSDLLTKYFTRNTNLDDFLIDPNSAEPGCIPYHEIIVRLVSAFYDNNKAYLLGKPKDPIPCDPLDFEVSCYVNMIKTKGQSPEDLRSSSIEIQISYPLEISKDNLLAVALPIAFLENPSVQLLLKMTEAQPLTYHTPRFKPEYRVAVIFEKIMDYLLSENLL